MAVPSRPWSTLRRSCADAGVPVAFNRAGDLAGDVSATLATMEPDGEFDADANPDAVEALGREGLTYKVWGGDWCPDCTGQLPAFAAALSAAGVPADRVEQFPVETIDGEKDGPRMDEYGVTRIPTVIAFEDGEEVSRFVESADVGIATYLTRELTDD